MRVFVQKGMCESMGGLGAVYMDMYAEAWAHAYNQVPWCAVCCLGAGVWARVIEFLMLMSAAVCGTVRVISAGLQVSQTSLLKFTIGSFGPGMAGWLANAGE